MQRQLKQVLEFHRVFGAYVGKKPSSKVPEEVKEARIKLIREESEEVVEAIEQGDLKAIAKEMADLMYVLLGTVLAFGLQDRFERVFELVHKSNLSKRDKKGKYRISEDGSKVLKGKDYWEPDLEEVLD